jgi:acetyltransferase-like isoleucine patch superfamily enzyme
MEAHATIGHLTACVHLDAVTMGPHSSIGRGNWITGFPTGGASPHSSQSSHFAHQPDREASLTLGAHAAITNRHLIDCTHRVWIGNHTTIAGWQSQLLTHSIDLAANRQSAAPITIGERCFVGTNAVLLPGAVLPDRSVLGAKSLLNKAFTEPHTVYAGVPARAVRTLPPETAYFHRTTGFVD